MPKEKYVKPSERAKAADSSEPSLAKPTPSLCTLLEEKLMDYGHLFIGTNDFEVDLLKLQASIGNHPSFEDIQSAALVSNGWMFVLFALLKRSASLKHVIFYDTNPIMILIYETFL